MTICNTYIRNLFSIAGVFLWLHLAMAHNPQIVVVGNIPVTGLDSTNVLYKNAQTVTLHDPQLLIFTKQLDVSNLSYNLTLPQKTNAAKLAKKQNNTNTRVSAPSTQQVVYSSSQQPSNRMLHEYKISCISPPTPNNLKKLQNFTFNNTVFILSGTYKQSNPIATYHHNQNTPHDKHNRYFSLPPPIV